MRNLWEIRIMFQEDDGAGGDPAKDFFTAPPKDALPANDPPGEVVRYDLETDPSGLKGIDLGGAKLLGKFPDVATALNSYTELEKKLGQKQADYLKEAGYTVPEKYEFPEELSSQWEEGIADEMQAYLKEIGATEAQAKLAVPKLHDLVMAIKDPIDREALSKATGLAGEELDGRMNAAKEFAHKHLDEKALAALSSFGNAGVAAVMWLQDHMTANKLFTAEPIDVPTTQAQLDDVTKRILATKDPRERKRLESERFALYEKLNK